MGSLRDTPLYKRYEQANLRGARYAPPPQAGAVVVVGAASSPLAAACVASLAKTRRVRAVVRFDDAGTQALLGDERIVLAHYRGDGFDWAAALSRPVARAARRGGCAGFKRGACADADADAIVGVLIVADDERARGAALGGLAAALRGPAPVAVVGREHVPLLRDAERAAGGRAAVLRCADTFTDVRRALCAFARAPPPPAATPFGAAKGRTRADALRDALRALRRDASPVDERGVGDYVASLFGKEGGLAPGVRRVAGPRSTTWAALAREAAATSLGPGLVAFAAPLLDAFWRLCRVGRAAGDVVRVGRDWRFHLAELADFAPSGDALAALAATCGYGRRPDIRPDAAERILYDVVAPARHVFSDALGARLAARVRASDGDVPALLLALYNEAKRSLRDVDAAAELGRDLLAAVDAGTT